MVYVRSDSGDDTLEYRVSSAGMYNIVYWLNECEGVAQNFEWISSQSLSDSILQMRHGTPLFTYDN